MKYAKTPPPPTTTTTKSQHFHSNWWVFDHDEEWPGKKQVSSKKKGGARLCQSATWEGRSAAGMRSGASARKNEFIGSAAMFWGVSLRSHAELRHFDRRSSMRTMRRAEMKEHTLQSEKVLLRGVQLWSARVGQMRAGGNARLGRSGCGLRKGKGKERRVARGCPGLVPRPGEKDKRSGTAPAIHSN